MKIIAKILVLCFLLASCGKPLDQKTYIKTAVVTFWDGSKDTISITINQVFEPEFYIYNGKTGRLDCDGHTIATHVRSFKEIKN